MELCIALAQGSRLSYSFGIYVEQINGFCYFLCLVEFSQTYPVLTSFLVRALTEWLFDRNKLDIGHPRIPRMTAYTNQLPVRGRSDYRIRHFSIMSSCLMKNYHQRSTLKMFTTRFLRFLVRPTLDFKTTLRETSKPNWNNSSFPYKGSKIWRVW